MPGLSGLELQRHLTALHYHIPIIFITAFADEAVRVRALSAGACRYLIKPFGEEELLEGIREALQRQNLMLGHQPPL